MSFKNRLQKLEAVEIRPGYCGCGNTTIEHRHNEANLPVEELPANHCQKCGLPQMAIWYSCINRTAEPAHAG
mgnify:CR=1 FL=1